MTNLLNDFNVAFNFEPLVAALGVIAAFAIVFLSAKGKLRDWLLK